MSEEKLYIDDGELVYYINENEFFTCNDIPMPMLEGIEHLQQKVEQLEKENKELKQPQVFIDCEDMEERYGRDLYEDYLKEKIEQLENIRKEAIKYNKELAELYDIGSMERSNADTNLLILKDEETLNILNKGSE